MIDTIHAIETPEGVKLALRVAGPVPRAIAFSVDSSLRAIAYTVALILITMTLGANGAPLIVFVLFLGEWLYPVLFEVFLDGQTIGKRSVGIRVVHEDGTRVRWPASLLRNLLLAADLMPGVYLFGLLSMLTSSRFRRIGDHAAGTLVVYVAAPPRSAPTKPALDVAPLAPPIALASEERAALLDFGERERDLSDARKEELARLAIPLLAPGEAPAARLLRIAAWLRGGEPAP